MNTKRFPDYRGSTPQLLPATVDHTTRFCRPARPTRLILSAILLAALGAGAFAADSGKAALEKKTSKDFMENPTGPFHSTTEQLIDEAVLRQHRSGKLLLLHINDVHEILKPPPKGLGGLAYVAGYVNQVRAQRKDTLFVDAGDILEKGDTMSRVSRGEASYRVLGSIGLDCTVPGNHDFVFGLDRLLENIKLVNLPIICTGMTYNDTKESVLPESMIKQVGSLKIGLIGATIGRSARSTRPVTQFANPELGQRINELAGKLEREVDLTILVLHNGTWAGRLMAKAAPAVDLVVCGHSNEVTEAPMKADTGALVVDVGRAGQWVGTMDLIVDCNQKKIARYTYEMIPMDHSKVQPDPQVARLIDELDRKWCPEDYLPNASTAEGAKTSQP